MRAACWRGCTRIPKAIQLEIARIAGIAAAKKTSELIPLCHPLLLSHVDVETTVRARGIEIVSTVGSTGQTGVEMEALTAAAVAALTVYDMTKALDKSIEIAEVCTAREDRRQKRRLQTGMTAAVITVSDSAFAGARVDKSGAAVRQRLESLGWSVTVAEVLPDEIERIASRLAELADAGTVSAIFTTGGTGIALRDVTPEATRRILDREIPGFGELMRAKGRESTPLAILSRSLAGTRGKVLIVNLPGSPRGALESLNAIVELAPHVLDLLGGKTEHATTE